jgi:hypothetical protein
MADYYDIPVPRNAQVTRRTTDTTDRGVGFDKVAKARRDRTASEEVVEVYQSELRPVKLFNDIIDELVISSRACDLTQDPTTEIIHRNPVLIEGELEVARASEVGELIGKFMPLLLARAAEGRSDFEVSSEELMFQFFNGQHEEVPPVMHLEVNGTEFGFYMVLKSENFIDSATDDLVGDVAVFGLAERIIREGSSYSLEKYLTPGLNRTLRRIIGKEALQNMVSGAAQMHKQDADLSDLNIQGPAVLLNVAGIFT